MSVNIPQPFVFEEVDVNGDVTNRGGCHEVRVSDGPDHVHHWHDHFYCNRPCAGR